MTVFCPLVDSYVAAAAREAGSAAEEADSRKCAKYTVIENSYIFQPIAVELLGPINMSGCAYLSKLGRKFPDQSGNEKETSFLFQRLSILIQCYSAILMHNSFVKEEE